MRNKIIKYTLLLFLLSTLQYCGVWHKAGKVDFRTKTLIEREFIQCQLDSLCVADTLSCDFNDWTNCDFITYMTNDTIHKRLWIKQWGDGTLVKYVVTGAKEPFFVEKTETYNANRKK